MVTVYWASPDAWSPETLARAWKILDSEEEARARRFCFDRDRRTFVVAHALLRQALSRHSPGVEPRAWRFAAQAHGKPEIAEPRGTSLRFSLSHTRGLAASAVTQEADIGLDVENLDWRAPLTVAPSVFSPEELADLAGMPESEQPERFFVYWTLKESYAKAHGAGLSLPFRQMTFRVPRGAQIELSLGPRWADDPGRWRFRSWRIAGRYQAALALCSKAEIDLEEIEVKGPAESSCGEQPLRGRIHGC